MKIKNSIYILLIAVLTSCSVGKNYQRPNLQVPNDFRASAVVATEKDTVIHPPHQFFKNKGLLALLDSAFANNSNLLIAVKNIESSQWSLRNARLSYLPDLNAQINGSYAKASQNSAVGQSGAKRESEEYNLSASLAWEIDVWGKIRRMNESALANYLQTQEARKAVQTQLVLNVSKAYYNLLMLNEQLDVAQKSKILSDSTLFVIRKQYEVGEANQLAVSQVEAQVVQNKSLISQIEQSIFTQENALNTLVGSYSTTINRTWSDDGEFQNSPSAGYPIAVLTARPDVKSSELALKSANARVGVAMASMFPALNISLSGGLNSLQTSNWFTIPASLFGNLAGGITQPLFNKGRLKMEYEQAKIEREKAVITFRQSVLEAYTQVSDAMNNREENHKQYLFAKERENALSEGVRSANVLFSVGSVNYLEVITVQTNYLQARLETKRLYTNEAISNIELYNALGGGWE